MSVKRYEFEDYGTNEDDGRYVTYEDYAALEQKLAESQREFRAADATIENLQMQVEKLAAENAGLKAAASCLVSEYMMNKGTDSEFIACITPSKKTIGTGGAWDMWRHLEMVLGKTPATDAFLAEVRAQGVELFASKCKEESKRANSSGARDSWWVSGENADDFAAQLRQEAAQ